MDPEKGSVCIKDNFLDRQKHLNEQLSLIEKSLNKHNNHKGSYVPNLEELSDNTRTRMKIRGFRGRQSIFKRPEGPAPRANIVTIPDYRRNPTKWTCYSLDDVSDMSNESNSEAAFSFLKELKQRKRRESQKQIQIKKKLKVHKEIMEVDAVQGTSEDNDMEVEERFKADDPSKNTISFRKPQKNEETFKEPPKPEFRSNKIIMPEYEVGTKKSVKKQRSQKNILEKIDKNKEMKLDHLNMYDDEEEE